MIDYTNMETDHTRNSIRNSLIPLLEKQYNPNLNETLARTAQILALEDNFLDKLSKIYLDEIMIKRFNKNVYDNIHNVDIQNVRLINDKFNEIDIALRYRILRIVINVIFGTTEDISKANYDEIIELSRRNIGNKYKLLNKRTKVSLVKGLLIIEKV